jgi:hypothetical protein
VNPCVYKCGEMSCHYTVFVCEGQRKRGRCAPKVTVEVALSGEPVRKARELHELRRRAPQKAVGFYDLGEIQ